ncbi:unnamed protein product [Sphagnum tenellum]
MLIRLLQTNRSRLIDRFVVPESSARPEASTNAPNKALEEKAFAGRKLSEALDSVLTHQENLREPMSSAKAVSFNES